MPAKRCDQYIQCDDGIEYIRDCAKGTYFNVNLQGCDHKNNVDCDGEKTPTTKTPKPQNPKTPKPLIL